MRARRALVDGVRERLAAEPHRSRPDLARALARMAADLGFADQSHLCRVVRAETGTTPAALRAALA